MPATIRVGIIIDSSQAMRYPNCASVIGKVTRHFNAVSEEGKNTMKEGIHPLYRPVVFKDLSNGDTFMSRSAVHTSKTITWEDGKEYPLCVIEVSSTSHPFYTGQNRVVDTEGRIDKFNKKYGRAPKKA